MQDLARALEKVPGLKGIDMRDVRRLAQLLHDHPELGEIELKGFFGTGVTITRVHHGAPVVAHAVAAPAAPAPVAPPAAAPPAEPVAVTAAPSLKEIKSPMVGTFYMQPEPGSDPYVRVGARVNPGQTVCIIEAMKIMNEIEAEISGVVREVCVDDASPVEYGQVLYRVDPNG
ncbi:MAG TPA: acetyl-CoA carboxylase biotin carboxyl carrier protein [Gemmatimonadales bacterium]|nr:acetyl-CoA carboxylase biotin carboxyl carrier protein [Gemmatimonadales bacterium]